MARIPRSAGKARVDGARRMSTVTPSPAQELEEEDVIPGRVTHAQWMDMLTKEDGDETVGEVMEELLSKVMEGCLKAYVKRQLAPFSASWAKNYLTQILEQQILCPDEGEGPDEVRRTEDSEPVPTISDAWAQGCVPVITPQPHPTKHKEAEILQVPAQTSPRDKNQSTSVMQKSYSPVQSENGTSPKSPMIEKHSKVLSPQPRPKTDQKKKHAADFSPKPVRGKFLPALPCPAGGKDMENRNRVYPTYKQKTGPVNQPKDYKPIPRLDPSGLPQHCMVPQYEIVDNDYTKPNSRKPSGLSKLEPKYNRQQTDRTATTLSPLRSSDQLAMFQRRNEAGVSVSPLRHTQERMAFSGPLRLDTMVLAKGVSLQDPQTGKSNPLKSMHASTSTKLRPIRSDAAVPLFSVDQITQG